RAVTLVDIGGDERRGLGVGPRDDDGRDVRDVGRQTGRGQGPDVLVGRDEHLATEVAALLLRRELVLPVHTGGAGGDHGLLQLVGVQGATEAGLGVGHDRGEPVLHRGVTLDAGDLVGTQQGVVDAPHDGRHRVGRVQRLVRVGVARQVGVARDLPAGEVHGLEAGADLLHGLVARQGAEGVDEVLVVDLVPEDLRATTGERVLLDHGALQIGDLLSGVVTGDALPAGVRVPVVLDLFSGTCLADVRHRNSFLSRGRTRVRTIASSRSCTGTTVPHDPHRVYLQVVRIWRVSLPPLQTLRRMWGTPRKR